MKIVFYLPDLRGGGAERVMLNILELYAEKYPNEVSLLLGKKQGELMSLIPQNINVFELNQTSALKSVLPFIKFCKEHQPDKVISSLGASLATALAKPFLSKKIEIINRLGNTIGAEKLLFKSSIKRSLYIQANKIIAKNSDKLIFQCQYMANDFIQETGIQPKSYQIIYNPVKIQSIKVQSKDDVNLEFDFIAIGRLSPQKEFLTLVNAVRILKDRHKKNWKFLILGEGDQKPMLKNKIELFQLQDQIQLVGFTPNPYSYLSKAKAMISTSLYEGFSNVIVEALSLGIPVIASDCPGANSEVIEVQKNGILFETSNSESLASAILKNQDLLESVDRKRISEEAEIKYDRNRIFEEYLAYIQK